MKNLAVIFGGCSSEYPVSLESAASVITHLDQDKYQVYPVGITKEGGWFYYSGNIENIQNDSWHQDQKHCIPAVLSPDRTTKGILLLHNDRTETIKLDLVFPVMHGKNGEDGTIQGLTALSGIPLAGCGILASALCMDKKTAHDLAEYHGIRVPKSLVFGYSEKAEAERGADKVGYPLFVKPVKAGSSMGVSKVHAAEELAAAVEDAFLYDDQVILEEFIPGFEVGCAILGNEEIWAGRVDEVELVEGFFDYYEKYHLETSAIHMPARILADEELRIIQEGKKLYRILHCSGLARVDMFYTPQGEIVFNEINTIPGFTSHSRFPNMFKGAGLSFSELLDRIIEVSL